MMRNNNYANDIIGSKQLLPTVIFPFQFCNDAVTTNSVLYIFNFIFG